MLGRFELEDAEIEPDLRRDYGEAREWALGLIGERLFYLAFTRRAGRIRVISLRKANKREFEQWANRAT